MLRAIVRHLKTEGCPAEDIPKRIVSVAIVDLDDLNAVLRAA